MDGRHVWQGSLTDGETARLHAVDLRLAPDHLILYEAGTQTVKARWPFKALVVDKSAPGILRIGCRAAEGATLTVADTGFRTALAPYVPGLRLLPGGRAVLASLLLLLVTGAAAGLWYRITPLSEHIAHKIPFSWEKKAGAQLTTYLATKSCGDKDAEVALRHLVHRLIGGHKYPVDFEARIVDDGEVNAFALPGGLIVVNRGLLAKAESSDEVAGVLAHEMQHVIRRHVTAGLVRGAIMTSVWHFTAGDVSGVVMIDPSTLYQVASLRFSRETEAEADAGGALMLDQAHISRSGFVHFFQRLEKNGPNLPAILSTHPSSDERARLLETQPAGGKTTPALSGLDWLTLKSACPVKGEGT